jgi:hypothetical protein
MVKSGTRKKTNDLLVDCFAAFTLGLPADTMARTGLSLSAKRHQDALLVNGFGRIASVKFATWSQIGKSRASGWQAKENRRRRQDILSQAAAECRQASLGKALEPALLVLDERSETRTGHCAGLSGHGAAETLALKRGVQVHVAACAEQAGQELHDTSPCIEVTRGAFA